MIADARCVFVTGRRGSGKTTYIQHAIEAAPRAICFDPVGQYAREFRWPLARDLQQLNALVGERWRWRAPWRIAYTPDGAASPVIELHKLSVYLWHVMLPYERGRDRRKLALIVEEMNLSLPVYALPEDRRGFQRLILQGRHRGLELFGVTQRPALVSADFRSAAAETIIFPLGVEDHGYRGARFRAQIAALRPHEYVRFGDDGTVTTGKNPAPGARPGQRRGVQPS